MPLYSFVLPVYSFWNMDDLSWGSTRQIEEDELELELGITNEKKVQANVDDFDSKSIPLKTWEKYSVDQLPWRKQRDVQP